MNVANDLRQILHSVIAIVLQSGSTNMGSFFGNAPDVHWAQTGMFTTKNISLKVVADKNTILRSEASLTASMQKDCRVGLSDSKLTR